MKKFAFGKINTHENALDDGKIVNSESLNQHVHKVHCFLTNNGAVICKNSKQLGLCNTGLSH